MHNYQMDNTMRARPVKTRELARRGILHLIYAIGLALSLFGFSGCVIIPVSWETDSREVIGARADSEGKVCEQIVHYDKRLVFVAIGITPTGLVGKGEFGYSRYAVVTKKSTKSIWAMEHFPSLAWTQVHLAIPIPNSDRWITSEEYDHGSWEQMFNSETKKGEKDMCLIVFSVKKGKIIRQRFKHVIPFSPRGVKTIIPGYIEGNADRSILRVHETDKITRVNTLMGEIAVETDASPPFISVGNDWRTYEKLLEQPILRE